LRVVIITGAPGVGKSETARRLTATYRVKAACLETDDVACISPWAVDEDLYRLMGHNVAACLPNFRRWGAGVTVVAGVLLPGRALPWVEQAIETCGLRLARIYALTAEQDEIRRRIGADPKPQQPGHRLAWTWLDEEARAIPRATVLDTTRMPLSSVTGRLAAMEAAGRRGHGGRPAAGGSGGFAPSG